MAHYIARNVSKLQRARCGTENDAWLLIDARDGDGAWLGPDDRWELLYASGSIDQLIAWGTGPCHKDEWIRAHRLAPR